MGLKHLQHSVVLSEQQSSLPAWAEGGGHRRLAKTSRPPVGQSLGYQWRAAVLQLTPGVLFVDGRPLPAEGIILWQRLFLASKRSSQSRVNKEHTEPVSPGPFPCALLWHRHRPVVAKCQQQKLSVYSLPGLTAMQSAGRRGACTNRHSCTGNSTPVRPFLGEHTTAATVDAVAPLRATLAMPCLGKPAVNWLRLRYLLLKHYYCLHYIRFQTYIYSAGFQDD